MSRDIGHGTHLFWSAKSGLRSGAVVRPGDFQTHLMRQILIEVQTEVPSDNGSKCRRDRSCDDGTRMGDCSSTGISPEAKSV